MLFSLLLCPLDVQAAGVFTLSASCRNGQTVELSIETDSYDEVPDGYDIFRLNAETNTYDFVGTMDLYKNGIEPFMDSEDYYKYYYNYYDQEDASFTFYYNVAETHVVGQTYTYLVKSFAYSEEYKNFHSYGEEGEYNTSSAPTAEESKTYLQEMSTTVVIQASAPKITYGKRSGKLDVKLKWEKDETADGYLIYYVKNYTDRSKYKSVDIYDMTSYKLVKEIKKNTTISTKIKKLMNGVTYTYRICSYKMVDGKQVVSMMSEPKSILMDYYSYNGETYNQKIKRAFGSQKKKTKNFKTAAKAAKQMKTIKIKVWDFKNGKKGKKVTRTKYITVNKRLAPSIKAMFDEIYKAKQKQVIKDIGCYSYRTGEHMYGMAIDINWNENYMIDDGQILCGSFWNPKKSKYSIPLDCEMVRIMARYGFYRGFWGDRKDYMHFSYFGE